MISSNLQSSIKYSLKLWAILESVIPVCQRCTPRQDLIFGCIRQSYHTEPKIEKGPQYIIIPIELIEYLSAKIHQVTFRHRNIHRRKQF